MRALRRWTRKVRCRRRYGRACPHSDRHLPRRYRPGGRRHRKLEAARHKAAEERQGRRKRKIASLNA